MSSAFFNKGVSVLGLSSCYSSRHGYLLSFPYDELCFLFACLRVSEGTGSYEYGDDGILTGKLYLLVDDQGGVEDIESRQVEM